MAPAPALRNDAAKCSLMASHESERGIKSELVGKLGLELFEYVVSMFRGT